MDWDREKWEARSQSIESARWHSGPWTTKDTSVGYEREWVHPKLLRYFVAQDKKAGTWFIADRLPDAAVPGTEASTREAAIRAFYKLFEREISEYDKIDGITGAVNYH